MSQATPSGSPPPARRSERRVERRTPCRVTVQCQTRLVGEGVGQPWEAVLRDASHEGFRLQTRRPVSVSTELVIQLPELPGLRSGRQVRARVVHAGRGLSGGYELGCALTGGELSPVELSALLLATGESR